ncbi:MAG: 1,4-alpha-glucan branching protein GlgB [Oscillospiraceae bacterium]|nr:1,4-alpha-glucan branching protein GlgB [Oscillospiraceae bacterium]
MDLRAFYLGDVFDAYEFFGAHTGPDGTAFRTYAPAAYRVNIIGEWTGWQEEEMLRNGQVYTYSSPKALKGMMYKYVIYSSSGRMEHCDPYGFAMELRPAFASVITDLMEYRFTDDAYLAKRRMDHSAPINIYEVHLGSWMKDPDAPNGWFTYSDIADKLISYCREYHFTHIEFMPLAEHPSDSSWGYQNTGFYAPTARYGTPQQLMELVDKCHNAGIGVIMDFVPVHFAIDGYALAKYDGTALYEYPDSDVSVSEWGTYNFIHSRREVCCFLQSAANYWLTVFHFDGLRMDAISRAIYWQGDPARGVNGCTLDFLKKMNEGLKRLHPDIMLMAEDSTSYPKVTAPVEYGGLGFDFKWDLGWMNDTLEYLKTPPSERPFCHSRLTFSMHYFERELYMLPLSHDENVHGKATIIQKMWGTYEQKFAQARLLYLYMYTHPGKKLIFMGSEFGQFREWDESREQDWELMEYPMHREFAEYMKALFAMYVSRKSLYYAEYDLANFEWIEADNAEQSLFVYKRKGGGECSIIALNFSDAEQSTVIPGDELTEVFATCTETISPDENGVITLPPFSGAVYDCREKAMVSNGTGRGKTVKKRTAASRG